MMEIFVFNHHKYYICVATMPFPDYYVNSSHDFKLVQTAVTVVFTQSGKNQFIIIIAKFKI